MNRVELIIFTILSITKAAAMMGARSHGMMGSQSSSMMGSQSSSMMMEQQQGHQKSESGVLLNYMQNNAAHDAMFNKGGIDDCGAKSNSLSDGIYAAKIDPLTEHLEKMQKQQQCYITKAKIQKEVENRIQQVVKETTKKAAASFQGNLEKRNCINKLDRSNHECFIKDVLKDFYTAVVWKVAVHDNVAQLWYHDKLVLMIVFETIEYDVKPEEQECFTFFPTSNVAAEENALGHVVNVIGKPAVPKVPGMHGTSECRPCTDFLKENTVEGTAARCSNSCDSSNYLFSTSSSFKTVKKNKAASHGETGK